jgi:hypothetical protein
MTKSIRKKRSVELGALPPNPRNLSLSGQNGCFWFDYNRGTCAEDRAPQKCDPSADSSAGNGRGGFGRPDFKLARLCT